MERGGNNAFSNGFYGFDFFPGTLTTAMVCKIGCVNRQSDSSMSLSVWRLIYGLSSSPCDESLKIALLV